MHLGQGNACIGIGIYFMLALFCVIMGFASDHDKKFQRNCCWLAAISFVICVSLFGYALSFS